MFHCTKQERMALFFLAGVCAIGSILHYGFARSDWLRQAVGIIERKSIYPKQDINKASMEDLVRLPYIGEGTARRIIEYRVQNGLFHSVEEIRQIKRIPKKNIDKFIGFLKVGKFL